MNLGVIGFGNMATAIVGGALSKKVLSPKNVFFLARRPAKDKIIQHKFKIKKSASLRDLCQISNVILLAVKPQGMIEVLKELKKHLDNQLVITVAAAIPVATYKKYLGNRVRLVRVIPNTPTVIGAGVSAFYGEALKSADAKIVESIFGAIGLVTKLKRECLFDAVSPLSGSGPAFLYFYTQSMKNAAVKLGLDEKMALSLAIQTVLGSAKMMAQSDGDLDKLIAAVTSKKGTTLAGLKVLKQKGFARIVEACLKAANTRAIEMGKMFR